MGVEFSAMGVEGSGTEGTIVGAIGILQEGRRDSDHTKEGTISRRGRSRTGGMVQGARARSQRGSGTAIDPGSGDPEEAGPFQARVCEQVGERS